MATVDEVRGQLIAALARDVAHRVDGSEIRNLATTYGILTDKKLAEEAHEKTWAGVAGESQRQIIDAQRALLFSILHTTTDDAQDDAQRIKDSVREFFAENP